MVFVNLLPAKAGGITPPTINNIYNIKCLNSDLNSGLNLKTKKSLFIVGGVIPAIEQSSKINISKNPEEKWPENYQAFQKPRKTGTKVVL